MHIEILRGSGLVCEMDVDFEHKQVQNYKKYTNDFWILPFNNKLNEISFEMFEAFWSLGVLTEIDMTLKNFWRTGV